MVSTAWLPVSVSSDDPDKDCLLVDICLGIAASAAEAKNNSTGREFKSQAVGSQLRYLQGSNSRPRVCKSEAKRAKCYTSLATSELLRDV